MAHHLILEFLDTWKAQSLVVFMDFVLHIYFFILALWYTMPDKGLGSLTFYFPRVFFYTIKC